MQIKYRADIDGLRAIAVLGVIFYHLDFKLFSGGFTGVDVFFVISGYLISTIIIKEIADNRFSFAAFYERRIRRILPAYFFLLVISTVGAYLIYAPETMIQYGRAARYTLVFISNLLFARKVNYFDKSLNDSPLLHTWTLSLEEQFYLFWPIILVLIGKFFFRRHFKIYFIGLLISSLTVSEIFTVTHPKLSFYMIYSRAWEFGVGAFLALPSLSVPQSKKRVEILSLCGVSALFISLFLINGSTRFPGISASFSVLGAALLIYSGKGAHKGSVHRLLSQWPLRLIGLISYSLYLWHWPLITYTKYYLERGLNSRETLIIIIVSFLISIFSYRYVETPFRKNRRRPQVVPTPSRKKLFVITALITFLFVQLAQQIEKSGGFPSRFPEINQTNLYDGNPQRRNCNLSPSETDPKNSATCTRSYGPKKAIIWGDSHADHYSPALDDWARKNNITLRQITKSACIPLTGDFDILLLKEKKFYKKYPSCRAFNEKVLQLIDREKIDIVILAGLWSGYLPDMSRQYDKLPALYLIDQTRKNRTRPETTLIFKENFSRMVDHLTEKDIEVILLGQVPAFSKNPVECYFKNITPLKKLLGGTSAIGRGCEMTRNEADKQVNPSRNFFRQLARQERIRFFDPLDVICNDKTCTALHDNKIIYQDTHHLNVAGFTFLKKPLMEKLK